MDGAGSLFPGFGERWIDTAGARIFSRIGGAGPALLLLHDYPETHAAWHKVASVLAQQFHVIIPDLRGHGRSSCPPTDIEHVTYSKRSLAGDLADVIAAQGHSDVLVVGLGRGANVAAILALQLGARVRRLVLLDSLPPDERIEGQKGAAGARSVNWGFLAQPAPLPEALIGSQPREWVEGRLKRGTKDKSLAAIDPAALADYVAALSDPDHAHATCEGFRAEAKIDIEFDAQDQAAGRRIGSPTLVLWATDGEVKGHTDVVGAWRRRCDHVFGQAIDSGHFIPEENPAELLRAMLPFLQAVSGEAQ